MIQPVRRPGAIVIKASDSQRTAAHQPARMSVGQ